MRTGLLIAIVAAVVLVGGVVAMRARSGAGRHRTRPVSPAARSAPSVNSAPSLITPAPEPEPAPEPAPEPVRPKATDVAPSAFGPGTARPERDGSGPHGWTVKGNADSRLFRTPEAPAFDRSPADVWFEDEDAAVAAGFTRWDAHRQ